MFRSTDNGDSWQQINNGLTTGSFSQIQFSHHTVTTNANIARSVFAVDVDGVGGIEILECSDVMSDKALLFGVATKKLGPYVTIAIGISETHGHFCQDFDVLDLDFEADVTSPGFPIDIQVLPKKSLGLAFRLFANINSKRDFIGFTLNLAIGGLR